MMKYYMVFGIFMVSMILMYVTYAMGDAIAQAIFTTWMFGAAVDYSVMLISERKEKSEEELV